MKEYTKPAMMALSISANDMLCGCGDPLKDSGFNENLLKWYDRNSDGRLDDKDFDLGTFGAERECDQTPDDFAMYCKFTANDGKAIFWS